VNATSLTSLSKSQQLRATRRRFVAETSRRARVLCASCTVKAKPAAPKLELENVRRHASCDTFGGEVLCPFVAGLPRFKGQVSRLSRSGSSMIFTL